MTCTLSQSLQKTEVERILRTVHFDHGFHFTENGEYTGVTATSLDEFASKLQTVDVHSVLFHYPRGDFQRWIEDTLGDKALAERMCFIKPDIEGEPLRKQLLKIVRSRLSDLKALEWVETKGI